MSFFCCALSQQLLEDSRRRHWSFRHTDAGSSIYCIGQRGRRRNDRYLSNSPYSERMPGVGNLDYYCLDQRQIEARGHPVVEQSGISEDALVVVEILLVEPPSDSLRSATLHLALDVPRVNRLAGVLADRAAKDLNLA